ncbi:MAG: hypothetical protein EOM80_11530 [Erysipelotrichia bacterium]|nr:hypothetical protein [Erysipelotrichia bacterium]
MAKKITIEDAQKVAIERGGRCLSPAYKSAREKLIWGCAQGHTWEASWNNVNRGNWCPICAGNRPHTIADAQTFAEAHKGKCLSTEYVSSKTPLLWRCAEGHEWHARLDNISHGTWCPTCNVGATLDYQRCEAAAQARGGHCLTKVITSAHRKVLWQCRSGHKWQSSPGNVIYRNSWCPRCSAGLGERICRAYLERYYGVSFPKVRPEWLATPRGHLLELDGYNADLGLAFEHQGMHHYREIAYLSKGLHTFKYRQSLDEIKRLRCREKGIWLLEIPEVPTLLPVENLSSFLKTQLSGFKKPLPPDVENIQVDLSEAYSPDKLEETLKIVRLKGGICLDPGYIAATTKLRWQCKEGHIWRASPTAIRSGSWCPKCAGVARLTMDEVNERAKLAGGVCLSENIQNGNVPLQWKCSAGHEWLAPASRVLGGSWCPFCSRMIARNQRHSLETMQAIAAKKGGRCLSNEYKNGRTKLDWECQLGHRWKMTGGGAQRGAWCPICAKPERIAKLRKYDISAMRNLATKKGGECLSPEYLGHKTKLQWRCNLGHIWESTPDAIISGKWCRKCSASKSQNSKRLTIEAMREIAVSRNGECLSQIYIDCATPLRWKCQFGHEWEAIPRNIKHLGQWCPFCAGRHRNIKDMMDLARKNDGKCLSVSYVSAKTKLLWECKEGHRWAATPDSIIRGSWCSKCRRGF